MASDSDENAPCGRCGDPFPDHFDAQCNSWWNSQRDALKAELKQAREALSMSTTTALLEGNRALQVELEQVKTERDQWKESWEAENARWKSMRDILIHTGTERDEWKGKAEAAEDKLQLEKLLVEFYKVAAAEDKKELKHAVEKAQSWRDAANEMARVAEAWKKKHLGHSPPTKDEKSE